MDFGRRRSRPEGTRYSHGSVLDHVFLGVIGALRRAFEGGFLERQAFEERFQADVLLGDLSWETSYSLPGEGTPPRVRVDVSLDWPTWSQSAYRSWLMGEGTDDADGAEKPEIGIEIVLRIQRLATRPELDAVLAVLPAHSPVIGGDELDRTGHTVEESYGPDVGQRHIAVEVSYEGTYCVEEALANSDLLEKHFGAMGGWVCSTLVRLGDLKLNYLPPGTPDL